MIRFITKTTLFILIGILFLFWLFFLADGYSDSYYKKLSTPRQSSLILGTSRAAQGLQPRILDSVLNTVFFNYAFTVLHSPYGKTYLNSVKRKIDPSTRHGIFIVTVDPWGLISFTESPEDSLSFRELNLFLDNTKWVNLKPNVLYLLQNKNGRYYDMLIDKQSKSFVHEDGWLEIDFNIDSTNLDRNILSKIKWYEKRMIPKAKFSKTRLSYLKNTIEYLGQVGNVYLVRLPIHEKMMEIENRLMPNFKNNIEEAILLSDGYLDLTVLNTDFKYTDGNHLHKVSGKIVSEIVADWISKKQLPINN